MEEGLYFHYWKTVNCSCGLKEKTFFEKIFNPKCGMCNDTGKSTGFEFVSLRESINKNLGGVNDILKGVK